MKTVEITNVVCLNCAGVFKTGDPRRKFCRTACRNRWNVSKWRAKPKVRKPGILELRAMIGRVENNKVVKVARSSISKETYQKDEWVDPIWRKERRTTVSVRWGLSVTILGTGSRFWTNVGKKTLMTKKGVIWRFVRSLTLDEVKRAICDGVSGYLRRLGEGQFYGTVVIQFVDGEIVLVRKEETFKPQVFLTLEVR